MNGIEILHGDCRQTLKTLPDCSVHCVVTSPPYFGLRDYGCNGQIGLEATPDEFVSEIVAVFREVRRVLRDDGVCWLNLGDSYATGAGKVGNCPGGGPQGENWNGPKTQANRMPLPGLKPKDLIGIPWMCAFALRADGWWLRQDIIWHKPNPMPESVTDRCTKAHEYIFLLTKSERYFFDNQAIQEKALRGHAGSEFHTGKTGEHQQGRASTKPRGSGNKERKPASDRGVPVDTNGSTNGDLAGSVPLEGETRNKRSVWTVSLKSYKGAHFATFPPDLIEPCVMAGTSAHGCCPQCGSPWKRVLEKERVATRPGNKTKVGRVSDDHGSPYEGHSGMIVGNRDPQRHCTSTKTIGWSPTCECFSHEDDDAPEPIPCTVLDPFNGSGTTGEVARKCGCTYIGCELNPEYIALTKKRLQQGSLLV